MKNNRYYMSEMSKTKRNITFLAVVASKTSFRAIKKGGFYSTKKDFKAKSMVGRRDGLLKDDGSVIMPTINNKSVFKRLRRFYPIY